MAPQKRPGKKPGKGTLGEVSSSTWSSSADPPAPFRRAAESLAPFYEDLAPENVYVAHVDTQPSAVKRKIFLFAAVVNAAVVVLFCLRLYVVGPFYWGMILTAMGYPNLAPAGVQILPAKELFARGRWWPDLALFVLRRACTFMLDFVLAIFVWPWPVEFGVGVQRGRGSPVAWRWALGGFRDREIYVRRSRAWDGDNASSAKAVAGALKEDGEARAELLDRVRRAVEPRRLREKTGYLTVDGEWDLDFAAMARATRLVDDKTLALDAFRTLVLLYDSRRDCWLSVDMHQLAGETGPSGQEEERRRQVFAFRDALTALGKEDLFFRWVEIVQFETSRPDGFGPEKQAEAAQRVRDLFRTGGVDFDEVWKESVGADSLAGM